MASPLLRLPALLVPLAGGLLGSCVVPPPVEEDTPPGLEAPMLSPPGDLDARGRLIWWQSRVDRMPDEDRSEAMLCMGELHLELREAGEARVAFLDALGGDLSSPERARAERGIGLSYYLDGRPGLGEKRLRASLADLDPPAAEEIEWLLLLSATGGGAGDGELAYGRMAPFVEAAGLTVRARPTEALAGQYFEVPRSEWRAASMRPDHDPMGKPYRITVHHSAIPLRGTSRVESLAAVRHIQRLHQNDRGWADIGYHFLIDRAGRVIEGRPLDTQGAHATGSNNRGNIGICMLGNFASQSGLGPDYTVAQKVSDAQWETLERLVAQFREDFDIPAREVHAHKEFTGTECPGPVLIRWVKDYRSSGGAAR